MSDTMSTLLGILIVILLSLVVGYFRLKYLDKKYKDNKTIIPEDFE